MFKSTVLIIFVFVIGFLTSFFVFKTINNKDGAGSIEEIISGKISTQPAGYEVIGFLPFWLLGNAKEDYSEYVNNLSIFSLIVGPNGSVKKFTKPTEGEPGYYSLINGKFDSFIENAKDKNIKLSLVVFSGNDEDINSMLNSPIESATNLMDDVIPLTQKYGFDEINLDIEQVSDASPSARLKFKDFVKEIRNQTSKSSLSLTIDVTASSFVKETYLVDPYAISEYVDRIIIMAYDFHYIGSFVTGSVAPQSGGGVISEYDVETALIESTRYIESKKIILGIPLYGYEWEAIDNFPRAATIPSTGLSISNRRAEELLENCASCEAKFDETDREMNIIYKNETTGFYHHVFYPENKSMKSKLELAEKYNLGGVALWALGYEGKTILNPLRGWSH